MIQFLKKLGKIRKVKSPKVQAGHFKLFDEKLDMEKISQNLEDWNPSHFKPFVLIHQKIMRTKIELLIQKKAEN